MSLIIALANCRHSSSARARTSSSAAGCPCTPGEPSIKFIGTEGWLGNTGWCGPLEASSTPILNARIEPGETGLYTNLDMVLTQTFKLGGNRRLMLQANIENLLDQETVTNYYYQGYGNVLTYSQTNIRLPITYFYAGNTNTYPGGSVNQPGAYTVENAARIYTLLTIGEGLVAQIPALLISTAAGIVVTRTGSSNDMGKDITTQKQTEDALRASERALHLLTSQIMTAQEEDAIRKPIVDAARMQGDAYYSTSNLWDDGVLDPADTRNVLGLAISAALNAPLRDDETGFGIFRM